jgi:phage FluMu gp28-like protein
MTTLEAIAEEIRSMPVEQRKQLVMVILDSLTNDQPAKTHSVLEFRGVGAHLRDMDAQEYVNQLRSEWDDRP